ncbi:hypothetical protein [Streptomyces triticirhizae]|nr:hypothetical protein [Streptomyces triticirhizae]
MNRGWEADPQASDTCRSRLPEGVDLAADERLVVIPGRMPRLAKPDIPDA